MNWFNIVYRSCIFFFFFLFLLTVGLWFYEIPKNVYQTFDNFNSNIWCKDFKTTQEINNFEASFSTIFKVIRWDCKSSQPIARTFCSDLAYLQKSIVGFQFLAYFCNPWPKWFYNLITAIGFLATFILALDNIKR